MVPELVLHVPRYHSNYALLGAFAKSGKGTISFTPVHPSAWSNSAPTGQKFKKFYI
jgi:hypothetical protein